MATKLSLSIQTPCDASWEQMQQQEQGRFCGACQKTVHDFTAYTDAELLNFFRQNKSNVCGRMKKEQLRVYTLKHRDHYSFFRPLKLSVLTLSSLVTLFPAAAGTLPNNQEQVYATPAPADSAAKGEVTKINGRVVDKGTAGGLLGVSIYIKGTTFGTVTDENGHFALPLPTLQERGITLVFSFIGYERKEISVSLAAGTAIDIAAVNLEVDEQILSGEVVVVAGGVTSSFTNFWWKLRHLFSR